MSASEKLKALEARTGDGLIPYELEASLPQIVAVMENTERIFGFIPDEQLSAPTVKRLRAALSALDDALTAGGSE